MKVRGAGASSRLLVGFTVQRAGCWGGLASICPGRWRFRVLPAAWPAMQELFRPITSCVSHMPFTSFIHMPFTSFCVCSPPPSPPPPPCSAMLPPSYALPVAPVVCGHASCGHASCLTPLPVPAPACLQVAQNYDRVSCMHTFAALPRHLVRMRTCLRLCVCVGGGACVLCGGMRACLYLCVCLVPPSLYLCLCVCLSVCLSASVCVPACACVCAVRVCACMLLYV